MERGVGGGGAGRLLATDHLVWRCHRGRALRLGFFFGLGGALCGWDCCGRVGWFMSLLALHIIDFPEHFLYKSRGPHPLS